MKCDCIPTLCDKMQVHLGDTPQYMHLNMLDGKMLIPFEYTKKGKKKIIVVEVKYCPFCGGTEI